MFFRSAAADLFEQFFFGFLWGGAAAMGTSQRKRWRQTEREDECVCVCVDLDETKVETESRKRRMGGREIRFTLATGPLV